MSDFEIIIWPKTNYW